MVPSLLPLHTPRLPSPLAAIHLRGSCNAHVRVRLTEELLHPVGPVAQIKHALAVDPIAWGLRSLIALPKGVFGVRAASIVDHDHHSTGGVCLAVRPWYALDWTAGDIFDPVRIGDPPARPAHSLPSRLDQVGRHRCSGGM